MPTLTLNPAFAFAVGAKHAIKTRIVRSTRRNLGRLGVNSSLEHLKSGFVGGVWLLSSPEALRELWGATSVSGQGRLETNFVTFLSKGKQYTWLQRLIVVSEWLPTRRKKEQEAWKLLIRLGLTTFIKGKYSKGRQMFYT